MIELTDRLRILIILRHKSISSKRNKMTRVILNFKSEALEKLCKQFNTKSTICHGFVHDYFWVFSVNSAI